MLSRGEGEAVDAYAARGTINVDEELRGLAVLVAVLEGMPPRPRGRLIRYLRRRYAAACTHCGARDDD